MIQLGLDPLCWFFIPPLSEGVFLALGLCHSNPKSHGLVINKKLSFLTMNFVRIRRMMFRA
jgi:hypothetical protein